MGIKPMVCPYTYKFTVVNPHTRIVNGRLRLVHSHVRKVPVNPCKR